jgi:cytosine/adenosine deaminase-related metal-dependent hydrolase
MRVEGVDLDLSGLRILPGLINAHDHLSFAIFPRLGTGPYANATEWARDIYRPESDPVRRHLLVPKRLRLLWGGVRNLLAGVTTVCHHDPWDPVFDHGFPVRVVKNYGWAHSITFTADVRAAFEATPPGAPFLIHLAEGTDRSASEEVFQLHRAGALTDRTVLIHAVGLDGDGWKLVQDSGASIVWCPRSNLFTLGRALCPSAIPRDIPVALGTDSPLTAEGDLLDELEFVRAQFGLGEGALRRLVTIAPKRILRLPEAAEDWIAVPCFGAAPELAVIDGRIRLISPRLAERLPPVLRSCFYGLHVEDRPSVMVRCNIPALVAETCEYLQPGEFRLGGRPVA